MNHWLYFPNNKTIHRNCFFKEKKQSIETLKYTLRNFFFIN